MRWNLVTFGVAATAAGYLASALTRIALRSLWPDLVAVFPLYGIAVGAALVVVGMTWSEIPGVTTAVVGAGLAALSGMMLIAIYTGHGEIFLYAWALVPSVASVAVLMFAQVHNDPSLSDRAFKAYVYSIVAFGIGLGATGAVGMLQLWFRTLPIYGSLTWIAVAIGALVLLGAILFAATSRTRPR